MTHSEWWTTFRRAAATLGAHTPTPDQIARAAVLHIEGRTPYAAAAEIFEHEECAR